MRIEAKYLATSLVSGLVAVAIAVAPAAAAATPCASLVASATECQSPGNVQIDGGSPAVNPQPAPYPDGFGIFHHAIGQ
jgi:hypothetical protein